MPKREPIDTQCFSGFIKNIRLRDDRHLRQADVADKLEMSLSFYSEIEKGYRRPLNAVEMEIFAELFYMTNEEKTTMYDLASNETNKIPVDLEYIMDDENGKWARVALRKAKEVNADEKMWKKFIWELEKKEKQDKQGGEENDNDENIEG
jgi:transcriptional regulator with XRE-family HTH domain